MPRRSSKKKVRENQYRFVFQGDPFMLNRLEMIVVTGEDHFPDTCSSAILESALKGLTEGKPLKMVNTHDLNTNVRTAVEQLYGMRDAGQFGG